MRGKLKMKFKVGDRVRKKGYFMNGDEELHHREGIVIDVSSLVKVKWDISLKDGTEDWDIEEHEWELIDEINIGENEMKKAETQLEKDALTEAKEKVVEGEVSEKAEQYKISMREYIRVEKLARDYRKQANELADNLDITPAEKKQLF